MNIHCPSMANFHFYNVLNITIDGLGFYNCGIPKKHLFKTSTEGTLHFQNVTNLWVDTSKYKVGVQLMLYESIMDLEGQSFHIQNSLT